MVNYKYCHLKQRIKKGAEKHMNEITLVMKWLKFANNNEHLIVEEMFKKMRYYKILGRTFTEYIASCRTNSPDAAAV